MNSGVFIQENKVLCVGHVRASVCLSLTYDRCLNHLTGLCKSLCVRLSLNVRSKLRFQATLIHKKSASKSHELTFHAISQILNPAVVKLSYERYRRYIVDHL